MMDQRETQHMSLILLALDTNKTLIFPLRTFFSLERQKKEVFNVFAFVRERFKENHPDPSKLLSCSNPRLHKGTGAAED